MHHNDKPLIGTARVFGSQIRTGFPLSLGIVRTRISNMIRSKWPVFLCFFWASAFATTSDDYRLKSLYCNAVYPTQVRTGDPAQFAVYGKEPAHPGDHPPILLSSARGADVVAYFYYAGGRYVRTAAHLSPRAISPSGIDASFDSYPIIVHFPAKNDPVMNIYFATAVAAPGGRRVDYDCVESGVGLPGGAMSGGN